MAWVRLDDTFPEHPKILTAGGDAGWLHVCALGYSNRNQTDGLIPKPVVARLSDRRKPTELALRLCDGGIWHDEGSRCESDACPAWDGPVPDGHYCIHDYFEYQQSKAELEAKHLVKAEAGRIGGLRSGEARAKQKPSNNEAPASSVVEANGKQTRSPTRPVPITSDLQKSVLPENSLQMTGAVDNQAHPEDPVSLLHRRLDKRAKEDGFTSKTAEPF